MTQKIVALIGRRRLFVCRRHRRRVRKFLAEIQKWPEVDEKFTHNNHRIDSTVLLPSLEVFALQRWAMDLES